MHGFGSPCVSDRIRAAATVILWRKAASGAELLMGQRGASAVFMPSKYVFPGGAVDPEDAAGDATGYLDETSLSRLALHPEASFPGAGALVTAARRELQEETGLTLSRGTGPRPAMRFIFRAITPPGLPRRFDARFFLVDAAAITGDATNFTEASGELSHLHWIGLAAARDLDLPFITEIVLAETQALLEGGDQPGVPFFDNSTDIPTFHRIL
ncbi:MAG: NUDIX hydrolase [Tabrizicola sp.]|nr:NUDIX hydrolase [Tabrizicola sp.]